MKKGGMTKKKGMARGGMKKKGYAKGGSAKRNKMKLEGDKVVDQYGAVLAEYIREVAYKDPAVLEFAQNMKK